MAAVKRPGIARVHYTILSYMIIFGGDVKRIKNISNGCLGDSCVFITSKPQQIPCGQYTVKIPGVRVEWLEMYFLQAS